MNPTREIALKMWQWAVDAVRPANLFQNLNQQIPSFVADVEQAKRILVVGAGKAGSAMAQALEDRLIHHLDRVEGIVNVPNETVIPLRTIQLHGSRPAGSNHPTVEGVHGAKRMVELLNQAESEDLAICLISGGGSALLPYPAEGISLADKQGITKLLHASGATINEMNCVRKHLSQIKGGRLAQAFRGKKLWSLILSDVVGDPLDVIASGPTAIDPSTFQDALQVLDRYQLRSQTSAAILEYLEQGRAGAIPETLKQPLPHVENRILGNNQTALQVAQSASPYPVLNLGSFMEGEAKVIGGMLAGLIRSIQKDQQPIAPPCCVLFGGETTVTLSDPSGKGGRNQELVLAAMCKLGPEAMSHVVLLSGGSDGEDGPTDAAGAIADANTWNHVTKLNLHPQNHLVRHDAYPFFQQTHSLIQTGLTQTNVMDITLALIDKQ